jgi:hypothetical protein
MAKQMEFTHPNGTDYPESYWRIVELYVSVPKKVAKFTFYGYKDADARNSGKEPIWEKIVELNDPSLFDIRFNEVASKTKNPQEVGYEFCVLYKDLKREAILNQGTPEEMVIQEPYSFFEDSIDV